MLPSVTLNQLQLNSLSMAFYYSRTERVDFAGSQFLSANATTTAFAATGMSSMRNFNSRIAKDFAARSNTMVATPPPEYRSRLSGEFNPPLYPYSFSYQFSCGSHFSGSTPFAPSGHFMPGSSIEESPFSSSRREELECSRTFGTVERSSSTASLVNPQLGSLVQGSNQSVSSHTCELGEPPIPDNIKMPHSKLCSYNYSIKSIQYKTVE